MSLATPKTRSPLTQAEITALAKKHFDQGKAILTKGIPEPITGKREDKERKKEILIKQVLVDEFDAVAKAITERTTDMSTEAIGEAALIDSEILSMIAEELLKLTTCSKHSRQRLKMLAAFPYTSLLVKCQVFEQNPKVHSAFVAIGELINQINQKKIKPKTPSTHPREKNGKLSADTHTKLKRDLDEKRDKADAEIQELMKYTEKEEQDFQARGGVDKRGKPAIFISAFTSPQPTAHTPEFPEGLPEI